jgi:ion channel-forming bestrophin family protein
MQRPKTFLNWILIFLHIGSQKCVLSFPRSTIASYWLSATHPSTEFPLRYTLLEDDKINYAENSRRFRRTYFNHDDWVKQRGNDRFIKTMLTTFQSGVVRQLLPKLCLVALTATFVCMWNAFLVTGYQDLQGVHHEAFVQNVRLLCLPIEPFTLSSPALGLLLVFRTNASYGRWVESRTALGIVVNNCRNLLRLSASWTLSEESSVPHEKLYDFSNNVWAFSRCLQRHLLGENEDGDAFCDDMYSHFSVEKAQKLITSRNKPMRALLELTCALQSLCLPSLYHIEVDKSIVRLCDAMGTCDRIFSSPVPLVYTRHTSRFLGFWALALPLGLWKAFSISWNHSELIPACIVISFFFFGIEELATQLEEPFSILPIENFVQGIRMSAEDSMDWHLDEVTSQLNENRNSQLNMNGVSLETEANKRFSTNGWDEA